MTLNEFLKQHPGYGYLHVLVDDKDVVTIYPSDITNMTVDAVKEYRSRDPFSAPTDKDPTLFKFFAGPF